MLTYLGGQTIFNEDTNRAVVYLGSITYEINEGKDLETLYSVFDGKIIVNVEGMELSHIFTTDYSDPNRSMYYGDYCTMLVTQEADEDDISDKKKEVMAHLRSITRRVKKGELFIKTYAKTEEK